MLWRWDGVEFKVLHPGAEIYEEAIGPRPTPGRRHPGEVRGPIKRKENDRGCVVRIATRGASALLATDVEARGEAEMLARDAGALQADVLLVPHHGSKTSSTPSFLDAVAPAVGLISVGYRNRFRHPHETVVARYVERSVTLRRTDLEGALHVVLPGESPAAIRIEGYARRQRYWSERRVPP